MEKDPGKRLGAVGGLEEIKLHPVFRNIDWNQLEEKKVPPPYIPKNVCQDRLIFTARLPQTVTLRLN
jgi:hypothetical protein